MTDLSKTQPEWNKLMRELGLHLAVRKFLVDARRKFNPKYARIQIVEENDTAASTSLWSISGVEIGTNTNEDGQLFVRITDETPGANQAQVDVYKATGGGGSDKVLTGSGNNSATITLSAANSSGLSGTVKLGTVGASESDDKHRLRVFPDFPNRANIIFDGTESEHTQALRTFLAMCAQVEALIVQALGVVDAATFAFLLDRGANFNQSSQTQLINRSTTEDDGAITSVYTGLLEDVRLNMADETDAGAQKVVKNVASAGTVAFDANNLGLGAMSAPTMREWAQAGLVTFVCLDDTAGREKFRVSQKLTTTGEVRTARSFLEVGRTFSDPTIGISAALLSRTYTITTPSSSTLHFNTTGSNWSFDGESDKNTNDGYVYATVSAGTVDPAKFVIKLFKSATLATDQLVAESEEGAAGASVGLNAKRGSGLTGTGKLGSAPVVANTATINLNFFTTENSSGVPDKFTTLVSVTSQGEFQRRVAELGYYLNSATSGGETIDDSYVSAGTFFPYEVSDA